MGIHRNVCHKTRPKNIIFISLRAIKKEVLFVLVNIVSWNTRGDGISTLSDVYSDVLDPKIPNIILMQEAGHILNWQFTQKFGKKNYNAFFVPAPDALNKRCTVGILADVSLGEKFGHCKCNEYRRPFVYLEYKDFVIASIHSNASQNTAVEEIRDANVIFSSDFSDRNWLLMGDFNCERKEAEAYDEDDFEFHAVDGGAPTHEKGRTLDFAVFSSSLVGKVKIQNYDIVPSKSDHFPIHCVLDI